MIIIWFLYHFSMVTQGTSFAVSFVRDLRNLTIIYKPNAFIYHLCQTSPSINFKRIRWHYESLYNSDTYCNQLSNNSDCFDFYYGPSTSVLVIKEPDMYIGKYTCGVNINSTYEINSTGWIDVKLPLNHTNKDGQSMGMFNENELGNLANYYNVPFILDENDLTSFGKRVQIGGLFQAQCKSIESSYPINFLWIHLKKKSEKMKTIRFIQHDGKRISIKENKYSSSLSLYSVELSDDGDYICIASNALGRSFSSIRSLIVTDTQTKPLLSYSDVQSRSVVLSWRIKNEHYNRFNYFIIYYCRLQNEDEEMINIEDYTQVLVDPRTSDHSFTFRMNDLRPFTKYEFRIKGFIGATPSDYSNSVIVNTLETIPEKIENLHGYVWNETSVVVHWTPPNSTNGPNFYYVLYYTTNTSIPFDQWSNTTIRTYPFHILSLPIFTNVHLFIRVATVNAKGSILSDFHIINRSLSTSHLISTIDNFQCLSDNQNQLISLRWSINPQSHLNITKYILYYLDLTENNNNLIRLLTIPIANQQFFDLLKYDFNISLFDLNYNHYHILRLHLSIIDQNENQIFLTQRPIYCTLTGKYEIDCQG